MATYIKGGFRDNKERLVTIEIYSPKGMGVYDLNNEESPIKISFDSIEIEYETEDMFQRIIKKRMSLNLVSKIYIGDILFSSKTKEVTILVKMGEEVLFSGYVEPYTYSQKFANRQDEFTLNCIDELGCLEYTYFVNHRDWKMLASKEQTISFNEYLSMILPTSTYYDNSKSVSGQSVFDMSSVSMKVFLGDSEDDMKSNEEVLDIILKYFNLHCIQSGKDIFIFDWNTIKAHSSSQVFTNIFDNTTKTLDLSKIIINKDSYSDDSTNISMSDVYNQVQLKVSLETIDTVLEDPLKSDNVIFYSNYKQHWYSEYISAGEGKNAHNAYHSIIKQGYEHPNTIVDDYDAWWREDWYFKLGYNPYWKVMWNGLDVDEWIERDNNNNPINLDRVLEAMKSYRFFPFIMNVGKNEEKLTRTNKSRLNQDGGVKGKITGSNYFVVSVNGNLDDTEQELTRIEDAIRKSCKGLLVYEGQTSLNLSPSDDETTNYLVFKGSITLNPVRLESGWFNWTNGRYKKNAQDILFEDIYQNALSGGGEDTVAVSDNGDGGLYAQQYFTCQTPGSIETSAPTKLMIYPFTNEKKAQCLEYNYSGHWDSSDKIDKLPVFECELKIGDKWLVETYENGDKQKPKYGWYTEELLPVPFGEKKRTFTIGFDPDIDDFIVGKEYDISNTVNGKISDEKGMAIPIKKSDGLSGKVYFKILAVVNQQWNEISRTHPTFLRHTSYDDHWKNLWSHVSSIWMKDFEVGIISDNKGSDVPSDKKDLLYVSDEVDGVIKKKDDEEFNICTMPTTNELISLGIDTNIAENTCINIAGHSPLSEIYDATQDISERPERLWVDQYWNIYSEPRCIIETNLDDSVVKDMTLVDFSLFGDTIPLSMKRNLRTCETEASFQQI